MLVPIGPPKSRFFYKKETEKNISNVLNQITKEKTLPFRIYFQNLASKGLNIQSYFYKKENRKEN
jgi:hypothetical protein